jgi:hypothetical protein
MKMGFRYFHSGFLLLLSSTSYQKNPSSPGNEPKILEQPKSSTDTQHVLTTAILTGMVPEELSRQRRTLVSFKLVLLGIG